MRDHDHTTSRFLGAAHVKCNLNRREKNILKIFGHNLSGYDLHLIIQKIDTKGITSVDAIPKSGEKFMSLTINNFYTFCDTMNFLSGSLDTLVKTLPKSHPFRILKQSSLARRCGQENYKLLFEKWNYPYEYAESLEDLESTEQIPQRSDFFSILRGETITREEYNKTCYIFHKLKYRYEKYDISKF